MGKRIVGVGARGQGDVAQDRERGALDVVYDLPGGLGQMLAVETAEEHELALQLVVDMGDVDFVDSSGLGSLVYSLRMIDKAGGAIRISAVQDRVRAVFELTKLHHLFEIYDDAGAAVRAFR